MKRQAEGLSCESTEETKQVEENGNKRIRLLLIESNKKKGIAEGTGEKSMLDFSSNEESHNHGCEEHSVSKDVLLENSVSNNGLPENSVSNNSLSEGETLNYQASIENCPVERTLEDESTKSNLNHLENDYSNLQYETIKASASDSGTISESHYSNTEEISVACLEDSKASDVTDLEPPVLNHFDQDFQNNESTDSFQSEGFEADGSKIEINTSSKMEINASSTIEITALENHASQNETNDVDKIPSVESCVKKVIDVDLLTLSDLKVTELLGHTDMVYTVAADEDFILSASADTTVKVWNIEHQSNVSTFSGHGDIVTSLILLSPSQSKALKKKMSLTKVSRLAITGSLDCNIKLWSVLGGKELASVYTFNGITCLSFLEPVTCPESTGLVVVGTEGGKLELWNLSESKAIVSIHAHEDKVTDIKVKDNYIYSVSVDGTVKAWFYEDEDICPVYCRKRKEISSDKTGFKPAHWKAVAVSDNIMYLGSNTNSIKVLDWKAGRLSLYKNQIGDDGTCECVVVKENTLFSSCYDSASNTGAVNVWKLPEMTYVCTLTGPVPYISSLDVVQTDNKLKIVIGGSKLLICDFDFSKPPSSDEEFYVREFDVLGHEIDERENKIPENKKSSTSSLDKSSSANRWCHVM